MSSKIEIISAAFNLLGKGPINDIGSNSPTANQMASNLYDVYYPKALSQSPWRFAIKLQTLNLLTQEPIIDRWSSIFQLPIDYLVAWRTHPSVDYEIYGDKLYTNQDSIILEYNALIVESSLPDYFVTYMIEKMAEILAMPITQKSQLVQIWGEVASASLGKAMFLDSQARTANVIIDDPIYSSKFSGSSESRILRD